MLAEQLQSRVNRDINANYLALLSAIVNRQTIKESLSVVWQPMPIQLGNIVNSPKPSKYSNYQMQYVEQERDKGRTWKDIGEEFGISAGSMCNAWQRWNYRRRRG